ncbi:MAG: EAL domain-containing protein (putative c-di-GMP-specific phosphodiesterase class I) [Paraglaciecola sp.]|jgi:EAL domain-containing protein (putative c-di-GMP-specific phosphodiesterase class I)
MIISQINDSYDIQNVVPFFQPIMDLSNNHVWRYECLARLLTLGESPFIPTELLYLLDRQHCAAQLTQTIFNRSASYFRNINMPWNINISQADMQDPSIHNFLAAKVQNYPNPQRIALEVTASNALTNKSAFSEFCTFCQQLGISLFIDNFAGQEGDIQTIVDLPVHGIKLAGQLTQRLMAGEGQAHHLIELLSCHAKEKNITLVAQHVEDESAITRIQELGIGYAQGFYFSEPKAQTLNINPAG